MSEFENGMCRINSAVHWIDPVPQPEGRVIPWCHQHKGRRKTQAVSDDAEVTCRSCIRKHRNDEKAKAEATK